MTADQQPQPSRRPSTRPPKRSGGRPSRVLLWALLLIAVAAGAGWFFLFYQGGDRQVDMGELTGEFVEESPVAGDRAVLIVFPEWDAAGFVTEERQIPSRDRPAEDMLGVMRALCEGPSISGAVSALPPGTRALGAFIDPQDRSVVLDFSSELVTGHPGGSLAESGRGALEPFDRYRLSSTTVRRVNSQPPMRNLHDSS